MVSIGRHEPNPSFRLGTHRGRTEIFCWISRMNGQRHPSFLLTLASNRGIRFGRALDVKAPRGTEVRVKPISEALRCVSVVTLLAATVAAAQTATETPAQLEARTQWWREAKFGMFIHWGIYAVPADSTDLEGRRKIGEWYLSNKHMQVRDYERFAAEFNPVKFDAAQWVKAAKDAGMKYIVITSKHHDGFCMSIRSSPTIASPRPHRGNTIR